MVRKQKDARDIKGSDDERVHQIVGCQLTASGRRHGYGMVQIAEHMIDQYHNQ
jgi:hypothetical protein